MAIKIKNVYYMLSYAYNALNFKDYKNCETEDFENVYDLMAEILYLGIKSLVKKGLLKGYIDKKEEINTPRGKIDITASIKSNYKVKQKLVCEFDEFSSDIYLNKILKTTLNLLIKTNIKSDKQKNLKRLLFYFKDVSLLNTKNIDWNFRYNKNNKHYELLVNICHFTIDQLLQTQKEGKNRIQNFIDDDKMHTLFEMFVCRFYEKEYPKYKVKYQSEFNWVTEDFNGNIPKMHPDIIIEKEKNVLIIDTKFYKSSMANILGKDKYHSGNLYQIYAYVKNKQEIVGKDIIVSGMFLYAKTEENGIHDDKYNMHGNIIAIKSIDLDCDFDIIKKSLGQIINEYFNNY